MEKEVSASVEFLKKMLRTRNVIAAEKVEEFSKTLFDVLTKHYEGHWFPDSPNKGSAYRCVRINRNTDEKLQRAAELCGIPLAQLLAQFPQELTLWIDPHEVSYRIGEEGSVGTLYENEEGKAQAKAQAQEARKRRQAEKERERRRAEEMRRQLSAGSTGEGGASSPESSPSNSPPPTVAPAMFPQGGAPMPKQPQQPPQPQHAPVTFYPAGAGRLSPPHYPQGGRLSPPQQQHQQQSLPVQQQPHPTYSPPHHPMHGSPKAQMPFRHQPPHPHPQQQQPPHHSYPASFRQQQQMQQQQWMAQQQMRTSPPPALRHSPVQFPGGPLLHHQQQQGRRTPSPSFSPEDLLRWQQQQQQREQSRLAQDIQKTAEMLTEVHQKFGGEYTTTTTRASPSSFTNFLPSNMEPMSAFVAS